MVSTSAGVRFFLGDDAGDLTAARDGWILWRPPHPSSHVLAHVVEGRDRLVIDTVVVKARDRSSDVTGTDLRRVPLGRLTQALRLRPIREAIQAAASSPSAASFAELLTVEDLSRFAEQVPLQPLEATRCLRIRIPVGRRKDGIFYKKLLDLYEEVKRDSRRPAVEIAKVNGIAPIQVHRWVEQANQRYELETARRQQGHDVNDRISHQALEELKAEEAWEKELHRRVDEVGTTWPEYCRDYGSVEAGDPIGAWDDHERRAFLESRGLL